MLLQCFTTVTGLGMLAYFLVSRFVYHDPEMQDPSKMAGFSAIALLVMGSGCF
jgi:hypothetical protein